MLIREKIESACRKTAEKYREMSKDISKLSRKLSEGETVLLMMRDDIGNKFSICRIIGASHDALSGYYKIIVEDMESCAHIEVQIDDDYAECENIMMYSSRFFSCGIQESLFNFSDITKKFIENWFDGSVENLKEEISKLNGKLYTKTAFDTLKEKRDLQSLIDFIITKEENKASGEDLNENEICNRIDAYNDRIDKINKVKEKVLLTVAVIKC